MKTKYYALLAGILFLVMTTLGCGSSTSASSTPPPPVSAAYEYATTSAVGDFAKWTIDSTVTPATFSVLWSLIDTSGNVSKTMNISGTCGSMDSTYHYRLCTVVSSSDANVQVGGTYHLLEVPGVALFVHPADIAARGSGTGEDEVHVGFTLGACVSASGAGDYSFTRVLPVSNPYETEMVGMYRLTSSFISNNFNGQLIHSGFAIQEVGPTFKMIYNLGSGTPGSNDQGSAPGADAFTGSCSNGVITLGQASSTLKLRGVVTSSGLMFFDGPEGFGGLVSAKSNLAATADDLAGKTLIVIWQNTSLGACSAESGCTDLIRATFGAKDSTGRVPATFTSVSGKTVDPQGFRAASDLNAGTRFTSVNSGYANNTLSANYPQPATIPGLFYTDETANGEETPTMLVVAKVNGKLLVFGNNSSRTQIGPCLLNSQTCDRATGNFVGFEP